MKEKLTCIKGHTVKLQKGLPMEVRVQIVRVIDSSCYPPFVECEFYDAWGGKHLVHEKYHVLTAENIDNVADLPCKGAIACEQVREWQDNSGRMIVTVTTLTPWDIETVEGISEFDLLRTQLI